jgi:hypothetical protein
VVRATGFSNIRKDQYGVRESIPDNGQFGQDRNRSFSNEKLALEYYDIHTAKLYQVVSKGVSGVENNTEVAA